MHWYTTYTTTQHSLPTWDVFPSCTRSSLRGSFWKIRLSLCPTSRVNWQTLHVRITLTTSLSQSYSANNLSQCGLIIQNFFLTLMLKRENGRHFGFFNPSVYSGSSTKILLAGWQHGDIYYSMNSIVVKTRFEMQYQ